MRARFIQHKLKDMADSSVRYPFSLPLTQCGQDLIRAALVVAKRPCYRDRGPNGWKEAAGLLTETRSGASPQLDPGAGFYLPLGLLLPPGRLRRRKWTNTKAWCWSRRAWASV